jgi:hypothetical protein
VLIDRTSWPEHRPWLYFTLIATAAASAWYFFEKSRSTQWPGGGSLPGFTFGVLGGLIIVFEVLLWWRKKVRVWRIGRAQAWMRAHIWLGLLCVPLLIYHSGFRLGGTLSTVLMALLLVVIVSGIWGLALQQFLPRRMLDELPAETIYSQIEYLASKMRDEAQQLVRVTCGPLPGEEAKSLAQPELPSPDAAAFVIVGAVRAVGRVQGKVLETRAPAPPVPETEPLRDFFRDQVIPFLAKGASSGSPLRSRTRAAVLFQGLKTRLPPEANSAVDTLESFCNQRRQWDRQVRMHFWLHNWLWLHFPLSVALIVLMVVHVWVALKYW